MPSISTQYVEVLMPAGNPQVAAAVQPVNETLEEFEIRLHQTVPNSGKLDLMDTDFLHRNLRTPRLVTGAHVDAVLEWRKQQKTVSNRASYCVFKNMALHGAGVAAAIGYPIYLANQLSQNIKIDEPVDQTEGMVPGILSMLAAHFLFIFGIAKHSEIDTDLNREMRALNDEFITLIQSDQLRHLDQPEEPEVADQPVDTSSSSIGSSNSATRLMYRAFNFLFARQHQE